MTMARTRAATRMSRRPSVGAGPVLLLAMIAAALGALFALHHRGALTLPSPQTDSRTLAPGVIHARIPLGKESGIDVVDVDLTASQYRPAIFSSNVGWNKRKLMGDAYTPSEWLAREDALAVVNGGYFGEISDSRKEILGLFAHSGQTLRRSTPVLGRGGSHVAPGLYVRSAFGVSAKGWPQIAWAATPSSGGNIVYAYSSPANPGGGYRWRVFDAVGCGPTLIRSGRLVVTDYEERLVSDLDDPRTFVAYDIRKGRPVHFVMGVGNRLSYRKLAEALTGYYRQAHGTEVSRAMCLDGGASSQLSYVADGKVESPLATSVSVPDAVGLVRR